VAQIIRQRAPARAASFRKHWAASSRNAGRHHFGTPGRLHRNPHLWIKERVENRIRFGRIDQERVINRYVRVVSFAAGGIFAFVRWSANDYGTAESRIDILRAVAPGERYVTIPNVRPGGECLLHISGWPKVEKVLQMIDAIETLGIDPADVAPEHWRHVHNRLSVGDRPQPYTKARHHAWLRRKRVMS
jgi:Protein of unknown function (DUF2840)